MKEETLLKSYFRSVNFYLLRGLAFVFLLTLTIHRGFRCRHAPAVNFLLSRILGNTVAFLNASYKLVATTGDNVQIVVS
ncbi:MAG TPA: hypothetical protein VLK33_16840 [Terriglobales bacterium]|nr:hypothetical protein [Terriglobales bacterium]